jgi:predicted RNA binding protein YcfA (HicA-like mRNA interferase family)
MHKALRSLNSRKVEKTLRKFGFEFFRQKGSHQQFVGIIEGERRLVTVKTNQSHFSPKTLKSMVIQSGLSEEDWLEAIK